MQVEYQPTETYSECEVGFLMKMFCFRKCNVQIQNVKRFLYIFHKYVRITNAPKTES